MEGNLATTYALIHNFLLKQSHTKAALAIRKAAKRVVILKGDIVCEGPYLDEIVNQWKLINQKTEELDPDSSSDSSSSSIPDVLEPKSKPKPKSPTSSSSESESEDSGAKSVIKAPVKLLASRLAKAPSPSSSDSGDSSDSIPSVKQNSKIPAQPRPEGSRTLSSNSASSKSSSSSESSSKSEPDSAKKVNSGSKQNASKSSASCSSSSSSSSSEDSGPKRAQVNRKAIKKGDSSISPSSSSESSSSNDQPAAATKGMGKVDKAVVSSSSESSSSSSEDSESEAPTKQVSCNAASKRKASSPSSSSDSSSSDDTDAKDDVKLTALKKGLQCSSHTTPADDGGSKVAKSSVTAKKKQAKNTSHVHSVTAPHNDEGLITKKRRMDVNGNSVTTALTSTTTQQEKEGQSGRRKNGASNGQRETNNRFMRVNPSKVQPLVDNSYDTKLAPSNDYGKQAHQDLIVTRGAGFRKEKNKKKRGSYRGGEITMESHSFKFT